VKVWNGFSCLRIVTSGHNDAILKRTVEHGFKATYHEIRFVINLGTFTLYKMLRMKLRTVSHICSILNGYISASPLWSLATGDAGVSNCPTVAAFMGA
jgi:hypothetical protein